MKIRQTFMVKDSEKGGIRFLVVDEKYGKRRQITFRIGPLTQERLEQAARLFNMKPSEYAKRVIMRDLSIFTESPDRRRRDPQQRKQWSGDEE